VIAGLPTAPCGATPARYLDCLIQMDDGQVAKSSRPTALAGMASALQNEIVCVTHVSADELSSLCCAR
jgi:hypothetical protein